jgi:hypothetical protein
MELLLYITIITSLFVFGYFLANDRIGALWSTGIIVATIILTSLITASINQDHNAYISESYEKEFAWSVLRLSSFAFGFNMGYRPRKTYWKITAAVNAVCVLALVIYLAI